MPPCSSRLNGLFHLWTTACGEHLVHGQGKWCAAWEQCNRRCSEPDCPSSRRAGLRCFRDRSLAWLTQLSRITLGVLGRGAISIADGAQGLHWGSFFNCASSPWSRLGDCFDHITKHKDVANLRSKQLIVRATCITTHAIHKSLGTAGLDVGVSTTRQRVIQKPALFGLFTNRHVEVGTLIAATARSGVGAWR